MKEILGGMLVLVLSFGLLPAQDPPAPGQLDSSVASVTVYADRARVTRKTAVDLKAGAHVLEFRRLPGWIDEDSVRLSVQPTDAGHIADVQVRREFLAQADDKEVLKAEAAVREIADQIGALDDELKTLEQQAKQIEDIKVFSMEKLPRDMASRDVSIETYGKVIDFVTNALLRNATARRGIEKKKRDLVPEQEVRARKRAELQNIVQLQQTLVRITLDCPAAKKAELSLTYMLPGATWAPVHELRAHGKAPDKVALASFAIVTQTSGEDWTDADISFSTQSSEATIRIPELASLLLNNQAVSSMEMAGPNSFDRAQELFKGQNKLWFNYTNPNRNQAEFQNAWSSQAIRLSSNLAVFQKLQTRGTTAHFQARARLPVRGDGRPVRVLFGDVSLPAVPRIVAAPELSLNAANVLQLTNTSSNAILPGRIALHHDGAFLGMTDADFAAPAESFPVFLGVADQIKLSRVLDRQRSSIVRGRKTKMRVCFNGCAENLSAEPAKVMLTDRVPVSENKDISVSGISIKPDVDPDQKGIVKWDVDLKPGQKFTYRVEYTIEYVPEAIEEMSKIHGESSMPSAAPRLDKQIKSLESKF